LARLQVRPIPDWRESDKLKKKIAKPKQRKANPDAFIAPNATKTVSQRTSHWIEDHYNRIATAKPK
jgi:hypothetical protein